MIQSWNVILTLLAIQSNLSSSSHCLVALSLILTVRLAFTRPAHVWLRYPNVFSYYYSWQWDFRSPDQLMSVYVIQTYSLIIREEYAKISSQSRRTKQYWFPIRWVNFSTVRKWTQILATLEEINQLRIIIIIIEK